MKLSILNILTFMTLVAMSMWMLSGYQFEEFVSFEKIWLAVFSASLCIIWGVSLSNMLDEMADVARKGDPGLPEQPTIADRVTESVITIAYGIPGCWAGICLGHCIFRPSIGSYLVAAFLLAVYGWTFLGFSKPDVNYCKQHLTGIDGDGI